MISTISWPIVLSKVRLGGVGICFQESGPTHRKKVRLHHLRDVLSFAALSSLLVESRVRFLEASEEPSVDIVLAFLCPCDKLVDAVGG